jgi:hypothetical protein
MPWAIAIVFLLGYELAALARGRPTLSLMVWRGVAAWPFLGWIISLVAGGLLVHFGWIPAGCDPAKGF